MTYETWDPRDESCRLIGGFGQPRASEARWVPFPVRQNEESIGVRSYVYTVDDRGNTHPNWDDFNDSATRDIAFWCGAGDDIDGILDLVDALAAPYTPLYQQIGYARSQNEGTVCMEGRPVKVKDVYVPPEGHKRHGQKSVCVSVKMQRHDGQDLTKENANEVAAAVARGLWACRDYEVR